MTQATYTILLLKDVGIEEEASEAVVSLYTSEFINKYSRIYYDLLTRNVDTSIYDDRYEPNQNSYRVLVLTGVSLTNKYKIVEELCK